jgi:hypothetical protein
MTQYYKDIETSGSQVSASDRNEPALNKVRYAYTSEEDTRGTGPGLGYVNSPVYIFLIRHWCRPRGRGRHRCRHRSRIRNMWPRGRPRGRIRNM